MMASSASGRCFFGNRCCNQLLNPENATAFIEELKQDQEVRRERFLQNQDKTELLSLEEARTHRFQTDGLTLI